MKLSEEDAVTALTSKVQEDSVSSSSALQPEQQKIIARGERLVEITTAINRQLTMLLGIIQENERERECLRRELNRSQDQVKCSTYLTF